MFIVDLKIYTLDKMVLLKYRNLIRDINLKIVLLDQNNY